MTDEGDANSNFVAGTVHLVDLEGTLHAKHASRPGKKDVVLVPAPSEDPEDTLNWAYRRKFISTTCVNVCTLIVGIASPTIYSVLVPISIETGLSIRTLHEGTAYMFLFFGWGCLVWQTFAMQHGKRPLYIFWIFATMAILLWAPYTKTNGQWIASKILQGFFGGPIESLCGLSMVDIYLTHETGYYLAIYGLLLSGLYSS
jgi:MFS family permease